MPSIRLKKMGKVKEWAMEQQEIMDHLIDVHGETVHTVEKILATHPELIQNETLKISLLESVPIEQAEKQAYENILNSICAIIQPENEDGFVEVYRYFQQGSPNTFGVLYQKWRNETGS
jgi:hypothetical protein